MLNQETLLGQLNICTHPGCKLGEAERIQKGLANAKADLRPLHAKYGLASAFEERLTIARLADLRRDADRAFRLEQQRMLAEVEERAQDVFWPLYMRTRECWEEQITYLNEREDSVTDRLSFAEHVHAARRALAIEDHEGCRLNVLRAWEFVPARHRKTSRFADAALRV